MRYSDIIILLARQRSGTNALRSVLSEHPDIYCHNEVFNLADIDTDEDDVLREANFFNFQRKYAQGDLRRLLPSNHERLFLDFLEYLRCFSSKRYMLIDVKYNTAHFLTEPNKWSTAPYFFYLAKMHGLRVVNLTRRNYLRYALSTEKAVRTGLWTVKAGDREKPDQTIELNIADLMRVLEHCDAESRLVDRYFSGYPGYRAYDYQDVFSAESGEVSPEFLRTLATYLGVPDSFGVRASYRKQSHLPLRETIANYDAVAAALEATPFRYCLDDEPNYRDAEVRV